MTPYELFIHIDEYNNRIKSEQENAIVQAYMTAYWQRVKQMPDLKKLLNNERPKKQMTDEEMLEQVKKLNAVFGGSTI